MPGIYGPPQRPAKPVRPARREGPAIKILRWVGTIALLLAAMALYIYIELQSGPSEAEQQILEIQQRIQHLNLQRFDFDLKPVPFEPIQTAEIIPSSAIQPAGTKFEPQAPPATTPTTFQPLQTAKLIPR